MANLSKTTQNHEEIRRWSEERGGKPSHVKSTGSGQDIGILRIDFPGYSGEGSLEPIAWEEWFDKFDERNLALLYEEETAGGERSNFNKIVTAETAGKAESGTHRKRNSKKSSSSAKKTAAKKSASASSRRSSANAGKARKKTAVKKAAAKKSSAKKAPAKKAATRKIGAKKAAKKMPAKKSAAKSSKQSSRRHR